MLQGCGLVQEAGFYDSLRSYVEIERALQCLQIQRSKLGTFMANLMSRKDWTIRQCYLEAVGAFQVDPSPNDEKRARYFEECFNEAEESRRVQILMWIERAFNDFKGFTDADK